MTSKTTPGPWTIHELGAVRGRPDDGPSYIEIRGPNGEAICTIFPHAGRGGVGVQEARANAAAIISAGIRTQGK